MTASTTTPSAVTARTDPDVGEYDEAVAFAAGHRAFRPDGPRMAVPPSLGEAQRLWWVRGWLAALASVDGDPTPHRHGRAHRDGGRPRNPGAGRPG